MTLQYSIWDGGKKLDARMFLLNNRLISYGMDALNEPSKFVNLAQAGYVGRERIIEGTKYLDKVKITNHNEKVERMIKILCLAYWIDKIELLKKIHTFRKKNALYHSCVKRNVYSILNVKEPVSKYISMNRILNIEKREFIPMQHGLFLKKLEYFKVYESTCLSCTRNGVYFCESCHSTINAPALPVASDNSLYIILIEAHVLDVITSCIVVYKMYVNHSKDNTLGILNFLFAQKNWKNCCCTNIIQNYGEPHIIHIIISTLKYLNLITDNDLLNLYLNDFRYGKIISNIILEGDVLYFQSLIIKKHLHYIKEILNDIYKLITNSITLSNNYIENFTTLKGLSTSW